METTWWIPTALSVLALLVAVGFAFTRRVEHNTARDTLITQLAANTAKSVSDAADAKVEAAAAKAEIKLLTERFNNSQTVNVGLVDEIRALKMEVADLKQQVKELTDQLTAALAKNAILEAAKP